MSNFFDGAIEISCVDVVNSFILFFDGELEDGASRDAITHHLDLCPTCRTEAAHEEAIHTMMRDLLTRSCCRKRTARASRFDRRIPRWHATRLN
jgi:anti-sigma factor RsiW